MTFLKKLGLILLKATELIAGFGPITFPNNKGAVQTLVTDLSQIAQMVVTVEGIGASLNIPGNQKLQAISPLVAQLILQANFMDGQKIKNENLFRDGAQHIAQGMAEVLNSLHEDGAMSVVRTG